MNSQPHDNGANLDRLLDMLREVAIQANEIGIPQNIVDRRLRAIRLEDAEDRGWSNPLTAAVVDLTERQVRNLKSAQAREEYDAELEEWDERYRKGHPIHQMLMICQQEARTCGDFAKKLSRKEEHVRPYLREAVEQGYLEAVSGTTPAAYIATSRVYLWERTASNEKRSGVVKRANAVLKEVHATGHVRRIGAKLTAAGLRFVHEYFDPKNEEFPTLVAAVDRERETHEERGRTDLERTFGSVVTFGPVADCREVPLETARRHCIDYPRAKSTCEVLPTRCGLDGLGMEQYVEEDLPRISRTLRTVLERAEKLGRGKRTEFEAVICCAPTPEVQVRRQGRPAWRPIKRVVALMGLLSLLPLALLGSGCGPLPAAEELAADQGAMSLARTNDRVERGSMSGVEHGDQEGVEHGDQEGVEHGDLEGVEHGDSEGVEHGDTPDVEHGIAAGVEHGDPEGVEHGDPEGVEHGDPEGVEHGDERNLPDTGEYRELVVDPSELVI